MAVAANSSDNGPRAPQSATFMPCSAVIFDCDGVLVDSESVIVGSWTRWAHQAGIDPDTVLATIHGRRSQDTVAEFIEPSRRTEALALIDSIEIEDASAVRPIPGAGGLVDPIPEDRWAVVTSGSRALVRARLTAAGLPLPRVLITGQDVVRGKPDPLGYLAATKALGVEPRSCVVLEDSLPGIRAARAAGVRAVLGVGGLDVGDERPRVTVPDLRCVRWRRAGLEVLHPALG